MKPLIKIGLWSFAILLVGLGIWRLNRGSQTSSAFPLSLTTLEQVHDGSISFEERRGEIYVHMTDRLGDGHIHILNHEGVSKAEALEILKAKQQELERERAELSGAANPSQPIRSEPDRTSAAPGSAR